MTIPVHKGCEQSSLHGKAAKPSAEKSSGTSSKPDSGTNTKSSEKGSETSSERGSETKDMIIEIIAQNPHVTAAEIAMQLSISSRGVEK